MKQIFLILGLLSSAIFSAYSQTYITRTGKIYFNATTKSSPEVIEAKNNEAACIVDAQKGDVRFQVLIKSFKFERYEMQLHFNEDYMESDKFPKSDFKGTIANMSEVTLTKDGTYNVKVSGTLTMRGITKDVSVPGTVAVKGKTITLKAKFPVTLKDYGISIPSLVADKVDKIASISVDCELTQK